MLDRELLDKIVSLVKIENHHQYIDEKDLRFLYSDIGLFCQVMETLDKNNIEIRKKPESGRLLKKLILEYQNTKDIKLIEKITNLSMYYIYSIVFNIGKKYNISFEILISPAYEGLLYSINTYDESKNHRIIAYISRNIYYFILKYIEEISKYNENKLKLEEVDKEKYYLIDDRINEMVCVNKIKNYLDVLTPIQKQIIELYYGFNDNDMYSTPEIGKKMNCSRQSINDSRITALKRIKKRIKKEGKEEYYIDK